jgi:carbonic anhydrase/acetyltransferase-like protein (isoleucine patch superfamily)
MLRGYRGNVPTVHPTAYIDQSAQIVGNVDIGEDSSVWMNAVVRGDVHWITIGRRTNVQDGCVVHVMRGTHPTAIGDNVTIAHGALLHGCTIEDDCLVGIGAIVLNGARVGRESIVAAGALIVENAVIPPRSLVMGRPGAVRRPVTDTEVAAIRQYAERYVGCKKEYERLS